MRGSDPEGDDYATNGSPGLILVAPPLWAQTKTLDMQPGGGWVDTGIALATGDSVTITATGQMQFANAQEPNGPEGMGREYMDLLRVMQSNDSGRGALIARIGSGDAARPFVVGPRFTGRASVAGQLFLAVNQSSFDSATGSYHVTIVRTAGKPAAQADVNVPAFPQNLASTRFPRE